MSAPPIECHKLCKHYGEVEALRGMELTLEAGEVYGLLGPNGAGKSTLTKILLTVVAPSSGTAQVLGHDVRTGQAAIRRSVGYVPQELTSDQSMTGWENLDFFARIYHLPRSERSGRIDAALERMGLSDAASRLVRTYSGGMRKRLDLAAGLLHQPDLLFLDEPSLGLDVAARGRVWSIIEALRDGGTTILLCTNYMDEAERLCDRIGIIHSGRVHVTDTVDGLKRMVGGDVITLQAAPADDDCWRRFEEGVARMSGVGERARTGNSYRLTIGDGAAHIADLVGHASASDLTIERLDFTRPSLDDVFLHVAGAHLEEPQRAAGASPGIGEDTHA